MRLELAAGRVVREERYLGKLGERIRDLQQGAEGLLYLITDSPNPPGGSGGATLSLDRDPIPGTAGSIAGGSLATTSE